MSIKGALDEYTRVAHRVQTAIAALISHVPYWKPVQNKHMRVGIDMARADHGALAGLLISKGVITEEEYYRALIQGAEQEAQRYEAEVNRAFGTDNITLG